MTFDSNMIDSVWDKAIRSTAENEANGYRKDECTAWIKKSEYGNRDSIYGWEIDHITPQTNGGGNELSNLRPLHWANNASRGASRLNTQNPAVKSVGTKNHRLNDDDQYEVMN